MISINRLWLIMTLYISVSSMLPAVAQSNLDDFYIPTTNSLAITSQMIGSTKIQISYNRPNKRGREIFGDLVPYGKVWRTGADAATEISFSTPVMLTGIVVDSGKYELFTIPGKDVWEIILQKDRNQWGSYRYDPDFDFVRFSVTPISTDKIIKTFTISFDEIGPDYGMLNISWDDVTIPIEVRIDLRTTVIPALEEALLKEGHKPYFQAAMFYYENNIDINRAAELMSLALEQNPDHIGMLYRQALILEQKGDIKDALEASKKSLAGAREASSELKAEYTRLNMALQDRLEA